MSTNAMSTNAILEVRDLTATVLRHGTERTVVEGVTFSLARGRSLGIVGESGAGKSMLIRSILGAHPPGVTMRVSGSVTLDGHSMLELAFSWLAARPQVSSVIAGATRVAQVEENVKAIAWKLDAEEMAEIDKITLG
jgi:ABC-type glutathione transport system ATPase component